MNYLKICFLLAFIYSFIVNMNPKLLPAQTVEYSVVNENSCCRKITFESIPNSELLEGLALNDQFYQSTGISFILENGMSPRLAQVGAPITAFQSSFGPDTPLNNQGINSFFLTDDGVLNDDEMSPLIVSFNTPIDSASGIIIDIDFDEQFFIQARDINQNVLSEIVILATDPGTDDGIASPWGFKRQQHDIHSIKFIGLRTNEGGFGLAFDNFVTCVKDPIPPPLELNTYCNLITFESVPNTGAVDGIAITNQFYQSSGVTFVLEDGSSPKLAEIGAPRTAFDSSLGPDMPIPNQNIGNFFLTDDGELNNELMSPLIASFSTAIDSASGIILDIDFDELFIVQALDKNQTILSEILIDANHPETGDGVGTPWAFKREQHDIQFIKIIGMRTSNGGFGLGFDNFVTCRQDYPIDCFLTCSEIIVYRNLGYGIFNINGLLSEYQIRLLNADKSIYQILDNSGFELNIDINTLPVGQIYLNIQNIGNAELYAEINLK